MPLTVGAGQRALRDRRTYDTSYSLAVCSLATTHKTAFFSFGMCSLALCVAASIGSFQSCSVVPMNLGPVFSLVWVW